MFSMGFFISVPNRESDRWESQKQVDKMNGGGGGEMNVYCIVCKAYVWECVFGNLQQQKFTIVINNMFLKIVLMVKKIWFLHF